MAGSAVSDRDKTVIDALFALCSPVVSEQYASMVDAISKQSTLKNRLGVVDITKIDTEQGRKQQIELCLQSAPDFKDSGELRIRFESALSTLNRRAQQQRSLSISKLKDDQLALDFYLFLTQGSKIWTWEDNHEEIESALMTFICYMNQYCMQNGYDGAKLMENTANGTRSTVLELFQQVLDAFDLKRGAYEKIRHELTTWIMTRDQTAADLDTSGGIPDVDDEKSTVSAGVENVQKLKFVTAIDNDSINKTERQEYSFGFRFSYWPFLDSFNVKDRNIMVAEDEQEELYVAAKYKDLQDEILNNGIYSLSLDAFKRLFSDANEHMSAEHAKQLHATGSLCVEYGIQEQAPITGEHLMVVMLFCIFMQLQYEFSRTFRKINKSETNADVATRNREYAIWSRLLRETVECYGDRIGDSEVDSYYHGIDKEMVFSTYRARFNGPTSLTATIEVATTFATGNGIVLELQADDLDLKLFDCRWFSNFANDDERLVMGGQHAMKIKNIYNMQSGIDHRTWMRAFVLIDACLDGRPPPAHTISEQRTQKKDGRIMKLIFQHFDDTVDRMAGNGTDYVVKSLFGTFRQHITEIVIDMKKMKQYYVAFMSLFFTADGCFRAAHICSVFPQCHSIIIEYDPDDHQQLDLVWEEFITELDNVSRDGHRLEAVQLLFVHCTDEVLNGMKHTKEAVNWECEYMRSSPHLWGRLKITRRDIDKPKTVDADANELGKHAADEAAASGGNIDAAETAKTDSDDEDDEEKVPDTVEDSYDESAILVQLQPTRRSFTRIELQRRQRSGQRDGDTTTVYNPFVTEMHVKKPSKPKQAIPNKKDDPDSHSNKLQAQSAASHKAEEKNDDELEHQQDAEQKEDDLQIVASFEFGEMFEYWRYQKQVAHTLRTLEHEVTDANHRECLTADIFQSKLQKAEGLQREMYEENKKPAVYAKNKPYFNKLFGIKAGEKMSLDHILSLVIYSDTTALQKYFKEHTRSTQENEGVRGIAAKNKKFANWFRLLFECVWLFGDELPPNQAVYHGVNCKLLFSKFVYAFKAPLSTTYDLNVAASFSNSGTGMVLKLVNGETEPQPYFDMRGFSAFDRESEYLFYGATLKISSILMVDRNPNDETDRCADFKNWVAALNFYLSLISGSEIKRPSFTHSETREKHMKKLQKLMKSVFGLIGKHMQSLRGDAHAFGDDRNELYMYRLLDGFTEFSETNKVIWINVENMKWLMGSFSMKQNENKKLVQKFLEFDAQKTSAPKPVLFDSHNIDAHEFLDEADQYAEYVALLLKRNRMLKVGFAEQYDWYISEQMLREAKRKNEQTEIDCTDDWAVYLPGINWKNKLCIFSAKTVISSVQENGDRRNNVGLVWRLEHIPDGFESLVVHVELYCPELDFFVQFFDIGMSWRETAGNPNLFPLSKLQQRGLHAFSWRVIVRADAACAVTDE